MENQQLNFVYGKTQFITSPRMRKRPGLSKLIYKVFGYTSLGNWARSQVVIKLFNQLPMRSFREILDLGAGLGEFSFMLAEALPDTEITALEILPDRVKSLREVKEKCNYSNVHIHDQKIETIPENEIYDLIFSVDVFEHIREDEMPFKECFKKLKKGGYLMVKIPNVKQLTILPDIWFEEHNEWLEREHIGQVYNLEGLKKRFIDEGFSIVHSSYSDGWISRASWELGYLTAKGGAVTHLLFLPFCKMLYHIERLTYRSKGVGNAIQVIGQKPV